MPLGRDKGQPLCRVEPPRSTARSAMSFRKISRESQFRRSSPAKHGRHDADGGMTR
jgi:hypothetical protein